MDGYLREAFFHVPERRVLGRVLQPLCARHLLALEAMENGYVRRGGERAVGAEDLALAVLVCSCGSEAELQGVMAGSESARLEGEVLGALLTDEGEALAAADGFAAYMDDYLQAAELADMVPTGGGPRRKRWECHWILIAVAGLVRGGYAPEVAWWLPIGEALAMKLAIFEVEGRDFRIMTEAAKAEWRELGHDV